MRGKSGYLQPFWLPVPGVYSAGWVIVVDKATQPHSVSLGHDALPETWHGLRGGNCT